MKIEIEVSDEKIAEIVERMIAEEMISQYGLMAREGKYGIRQATEKSVKEIIYSRKDEMIERCVVRASTELVKKGLPKLLERIGEIKETQEG